MEKIKNKKNKKIYIRGLEPKLRECMTDYLDKLLDVQNFTYFALNFSLSSLKYHIRIPRKYPQPS